MDYLFREYLAWITENHEFYMELKEHESMLYDRFLPVYAVLDHVYQEVKGDKMQFDGDLKRIFNVGLEFLHEQFESCKLYLDTKFKGDLHAFLAYAPIVNYILFVEDVRYELVEKQTKYDEAKLEDLLDRLEEYLDEKAAIDENIGVYVDSVVKDVIGDAALRVLRHHRHLHGRRRDVRTVSLRGRGNRPWQRSLGKGESHVQPQAIHRRLGPPRRREHRRRRHQRALRKTGILALDPARRDDPLDRPPDQGVRAASGVRHEVHDARRLRPRHRRSLPARQIGRRQRAYARA
ncbi:MAG: hypothetical protein MZU97_14805 [Bacillus subtilis]|nr:hypothetical protein [Bacillus subtilis]